MKRGMDEGGFGFGGGKRPRPVPMSDPDSIELRCLIPSKSAGGIIGKGGENIKALRSQAPFGPPPSWPFQPLHTRILLPCIIQQIDRDHRPNPNPTCGLNPFPPQRPFGSTVHRPSGLTYRPSNYFQYNAAVNIPDSNSPERILYISASYESACDCLREILPKVDEPKARGDVEARVLVHQSQAGAIIGRAGFKIKELREATGTGIKVFAECAPASTDRIVQINGDPDKCTHAVREVLKICLETPIKGPIKPYDTINYDPSMIGEYGGYTPDGRFRGPPGGGRGGPGGPLGYGPPQGQRGVRGGPPGGPHFPDPYGGGGAYGMPPMNPAGMGPGGAPGGPPMMPNQAYTGGTPQTSQVTIPHELAGTIIGKGGERINRIREDSGAQIVVDPQQPGSEERIITITGNPHQIQMAQYLLQQCVRSSAAGRRYIQQQGQQ